MSSARHTFSCGHVFQLLVPPANQKRRALPSGPALRDVSALLVKATPPTTEHGRVSLTNYLSSARLFGPQLHQWESFVPPIYVGRCGQENDGGGRFPPTPFLCDRAAGGGATSLVYCIVERRVLGNVVPGRSTDRLIFGPVPPSSPI